MQGRVAEARTEIQSKARLMGVQLVEAKLAGEGGGGGEEEALKGCKLSCRHCIKVYGFPSSERESQQVEEEQHTEVGFLDLLKSRTLLIRLLVN